MRKFVSSIFFVTFASISVVQFASPASAEAQTFPSQSGVSNFVQAWTQWNASSGDLGPGVTCIGCGVPLVPNTYFGGDAYLSTVGGAAVTLSAAVSTGTLVVNPGVNGSLTAQALPHGGYSLNSAWHFANAGWTQTGATVSTNIQPSFNFSNDLSGQFCFVACTSFGTSLGSANVSPFTALGYNTAGSGSLTVLGATYNGANISTQYASVKLGGPVSFFGAAGPGTADTRSTAPRNVASVSIDLANIAASAGKLPPLNGSYHIPVLGDLSYDLLNAQLNLNETLTLSTTVLMKPTWDLKFFNADGSPLALQLVDPVTGQLVQPHSDNYPFFVGDNGPEDLEILTGGQNLKGAYGELTTSYSLTVTETADVGFSGDLNMSALGGSAFGAGFGPLWSQDWQLFNTDTQVYDGTSSTFVSNTEKFYFPAAAVPEPATWAMLILGVAMIGLAARRRSQGIALAA